MFARRTPLSLAIPWLTFDAIRAISSVQRSNWSVFEYGSGHSTLYWRKFGMRVVSVENNPNWYAYMVKALQGRESEDIRLIYASTKEAYVESIDEFGEPGFDLILVDGAYRRECVLVAVKHVRAGGYLVVDNTDWHWLTDSPYAGIPSNWTRSVYAGYAPMIGYRSETTLWQRPLEQDA
jgi:predicted O-methyltransferase YrrM